MLRLQQAEVSATQRAARYTAQMQHEWCTIGRGEPAKPRRQRGAAAKDDAELLEARVRRAVVNGHEGRAESARRALGAQTKLPVEPGLESRAVESVGRPAGPSVRAASDTHGQHRGGRGGRCKKFAPVHYPLLRSRPRSQEFVAGACRAPTAPIPPVA